jgi:signal peptidase I
MNDKMKKIIIELYPYVLIILIVVIIRTFIATPVIVSGDSMKPNLNNGELLLVRKIGYSSKNIDREDIVVLKTKDESGREEEIIKRIIGLPGEHISYKNNKLYVNDKYIKETYLFRDTKDFNLEEICSCTTIPEGKYLVLGDNRPISKDSTEFGLVDAENIIGKAIFRMWPLTKIGSVYK